MTEQAKPQAKKFKDLAPVAVATDTDARTQAQKFADLARELEVDESEERFGETVRKIAEKKVPKDAEGDA